MSVFNPTQRQIWRRILNEGLVIEDIKNICFELAIEYENIPGETRNEKINGLLDLLFRENRLEEFKEYMVEASEFSHISLPNLGELVGESPYVGLRPFRKENAKNFYGREVFVHQLLDHIDKYPFVSVLGPSGSGKSSLMFAGLLPKVEEKPDWLVLTNRPHEGATPLHALVATLISSSLQDRLPHERIQAIRETTERIRTDELTLMDLVTDLAEANDQLENILIYIDQFEEIFTTEHRNEWGQIVKGDQSAASTEFLHKLKQFVNSSTKRIRPVIVLTMRADFLGTALAQPDLADILNSYPDVKLRAMKVERDPENPDELSELEKAIILPAQNAGASFQEGLVDVIIEDIGEGAGKLPLLQFALTELWNVQENGLLTHDGYRYIGQIEGALANHADSIYDDLPPYEKRIARQLFTQLVLPGAGTPDTRRIATRPELGEELWQLGQKFATDNTRLVITETEDEQETIQLTHEALISNWDKLVDWMNEDRTFREWQEQFRADVQLWKSEMMHESFLYSGSRLAQSLEQIKDRQLKLPDEEAHFVDVSRFFEEKAAREELEKARKLAEAKQNELEEQERRVRVTRWALAVISLLMVGSLAAAFIAYQSSQTALLQKQIAQTQALMSLSTSVLPEHISPSKFEAEQAILMGIQAYRNNEANDGEWLTTSFVNEQIRDLMSELERPVYETLVTGPNETFLGELPSYLDLDISADGRYLVATESGGYTHLWDLNSPESDPMLFSNFVDGDRTEHEVVISTDGSFLATMLDEINVGIWSTDDNTQPLAVLEGHSEIVVYLDLSLDDQLLVTGGWDDVVNVWDVSSLPDVGEPILSIIVPGLLADVAFSSDDQTIFTISEANELVEWDLSTGERLNTQTFPGSLRDIAISPQGVILLGAELGQHFLVKDGQVTELDGQVSFSTDVMFSPDGSKFATVNDDKTVFLWDTDDPSDPIPLQGHVNIANTAVFLPKGNQLISGGIESPLLIWALEQPITSPQIVDIGSWVLDLSWSPDGENLIAGYRDGALDIINAQDLDDINRIIDGGDERLRYVTYSPDNRWIATATEASTLQIRDANDPESLIYEWSPGNPNSSFKDIAFSADGEHFVTSYKSDLYIWQTADWDQTPQRVSFRGEGVINALALSSDGSQIALSLDDGLFEILLYPFPNFDLDQPTEVIEGHASAAVALSFSADGRWLASGSDAAKIGIFDLENEGAQLELLDGHQAFIWEVGFSPDSQFIVSASDDNTVRVWDVNNLDDESQLLEGHEAFVWTAEFSPDGKYIASGSSDFTMRIWPTIDTLVELACERVTRNLTQEEWSRFLPDQSYEATCPNLPPHPSTQ